MHIIRWLSFGLTGAGTRTLVHFFPTAGNLTAPYPAQCKLTAFAEGIGVRSVTIDGGRVSQPDGVWLHDAFPSFEEERVNFVGLSVEVSTMQPKLDISASACSVEFVTEGFSTRFRPYRSLASKGRSAQPPLEPIVGLGLYDKRTVSSLVIVNCSNQPVDLPLGVIEKNRDGSGSLNPFNPGPVAPSALREVELGEQYFRNAYCLESAFREEMCLPIIADGERNPDVVYYLVYRDASSRCPISVSWL